MNEEIVAATVDAITKKLDRKILHISLLSIIVLIVGSIWITLWADHKLSKWESAIDRLESKTWQIDDANNFGWQLAMSNRPIVGSVLTVPDSQTIFDRRKQSERN
jgi:hypothetical protein